MSLQEMRHSAFFAEEPRHDGKIISVRMDEERRQIEPRQMFAANAIQCGYIAVRMLHDDVHRHVEIGDYPGVATESMASAELADRLEQLLHSGADRQRRLSDNAIPMRVRLAGLR